MNKKELKLNVYESRLRKIFEGVRVEQDKWKRSMKEVKIMWLEQKDYID